MANFDRQVKRANKVDQLESMIRALETFEVRATMMLGVYEALAGPVEATLMQAVQDGIAGKEYKTKAEFYTAVVSVAKGILVEQEFERASAELAAQSQEAPSSQDTLSAAVAGLQLSVSDTSGTSGDGQGQG